jgi:Cd2+/Zn2+-exporting ATPase/Cu+-exporting ATPase
VLLGNDLARFVDTVAVSRQARRIIWFNFAGTVLVDVVGIALIFMGYVGPMLAAIIHTASEFAFIMNSARLLPLTSPFSRTMPPKNTTTTKVISAPIRAGSFRLGQPVDVDAVGDSRL